MTSDGQESLLGRGAAGDGDAAGADGTDRDSTVDLLRRALASPPVQKRSVLPEVQKRIYQQSRGRYFGRRRFDSMPLLLGTAILILLLGAVIYAVLLPLLAGGQAPAAAPNAHWPSASARL